MFNVKDQQLIKEMLVRWHARELALGEHKHLIKLLVAERTELKKQLASAKGY